MDGWRSLSVAWQRVALAGALLCPTAVAVAESWTTYKGAVRQDDGTWVVACRAVLLDASSGTHQTALAADEVTARMRRWRGDGDQWKPVLWLPMDPTGGPSRETMDRNVLSSYVCKQREGEDDPSCDLASEEYGFRYRLNEENRTMDAWGGTWSLEYRNHDDELDLETSYAYTIWFDWPEELLATDDKTSIRLVFEGLAINRGVDAFRRMRARVTFEYGAEAFADVTRCVEDHRKGGRAGRTPDGLGHRNAAIAAAARSVVTDRWPLQSAFIASTGPSW